MIFMLSITGISADRTDCRTAHSDACRAFAPSASNVSMRFR